MVTISKILNGKSIRKENHDLAVCHTPFSNLDGKTIRGSKNHDHKAYHVVSAFVAENQIILEEIPTKETSNEITAVPELLNSLEIRNSIITTDAMSYQKEIVQTITAKKADYVIALKGNQPGLLKMWPCILIALRKILLFFSRLKKTMVG